MHSKKISMRVTEGILMVCPAERIGGNSSLIFIRCDEITKMLLQVSALLQTWSVGMRVEFLVAFFINGFCYVPRALKMDILLNMVCHVPWK